jgi:hypothetical protein
MTPGGSAGLSSPAAAGRGSDPSLLRAAAGRRALLHRIMGSMRLLAFRRRNDFAGIMVACGANCDFCMLLIFCSRD